MLRVRPAGGLVAGGVQIGIERVQDHHGQFVAETVDLFFAPIAVEAGGAGDLLRERVAVVPFADKNVAQEASGVDVVDAAAGLTAGVGQAKEDFPLSGELGAVVPGLRRIDLRMMTLGAVDRFLLLDQLFFRVEIENALAGVADDRLSPRANFVVGLRTEDHLASHALMIADFSDAAAAELGDALVVAEQVFADSGAELVAFGLGFGE